MANQGLNLGLVDQVPLQDCQTWSKPDDIKSSPRDGQLMINKQKALQNLEDRINHSPRSRNNIMKEYYSNQDMVNSMRRLKGVESTYQSSMNLTSLQEKAPSPTYQLTTDNPPYGQYPKMFTSYQMQNQSPQPPNTLPISNRSYANILKLTKKCYMGEDQMPWIKTKIDLSFPEIKQVHLDGTKANPKMDQIMTLAYMRRDSDLKINKSNIKIQNKTINNNEEAQQYFQNVQSAVYRKQEHDSSQISLFGDKTQRENMSMRFQGIAQGLMNNKSQNQSRSQSVMNGGRKLQNHTQSLLMNQYQNNQNKLVDLPKVDLFNQSAIEIKIDDQDLLNGSSNRVNQDSAKNLNQLQNAYQDNSQLSNAQSQTKTPTMSNFLLKKRNSEAIPSNIKLKPSKNRQYMVPDLSDQFNMMESLRKAKELIQNRKDKNMNIQRKILANNSNITINGKQL
eukprot:403357825